MSPKLIVEQKITLMVNQYRIYNVENGKKSDLVAFAQQKRLAFREKVTFYTDETKAKEVFGFHAEKILDVHGRYFVTDPDGNTLGSFQKSFKKSLLNSTWNILDGDEPVITISETNKILAVVRRVLDFIPIIGDFADILMILLRVHFTFVDTKTDKVIGHYMKKTRFRDHYELSMNDDTFDARDWRVWAAMAVALDALQGR